MRYRFDAVAPGQTVRVRLRLRSGPMPDRPFGKAFNAVLRDRRAEADAFYATVIPDQVDDVDRLVARRAFAGLLLSSILLGLAFLAIAYFVSVVVSERSTAAGISVGLWLLFVIVFDLALMGMLVASKGGVGADLFPSLLLLNPADAYRLFNLSAFENVRKISGLGGLSASAQFAPVTLLAALIAWIGIPLLGAIAIFNRREA